MTLEEEAANKETTPERLREMAFQSHEIDMIIARNSKTPQDVLKKLAESENNEIRKTVTTNPNTPPEILLDLGKDFPEELLANPVFNLMLLANPNLLGDMPEETLISIIKLPDIRESFVIWALNHRRKGSVLLAIICHHVHVWNKWRKNNINTQINLRYADLSGVNLRYANLRYADLNDACLTGADLSGANLKKAYLCGTELSHVDLRGANLTDIKLDENTFEK